MTFFVQQRPSKFYIERLPATTAEYWHRLATESGNIICTEKTERIILSGGFGPGLVHYVRKRQNVFPVEED